jgi:threonine-phosphate decarboxylase
LTAEIQDGENVITRVIHHGGNQWAIRRRLGLGDRPLLDVSVSLNPLGPPERALEAAHHALDHAGSYPEPGSPQLAAALAERLGVPAESVLVGSGTTEIISLIAQALREPMRHRRGDEPVSHLVDPIYGEYRRAATLNGLATRSWERPALAWSTEFVPQGRGLYWTGNPVSPLGHLWPSRARMLAAVGTHPDLLFVVDEAYLPFLADEPERTLVRAAPERANLIVLRSVTKVYDIPGLRVGYAVGPAALVQRLRQFQNPWSVDSASEAALLSALDDREYHERTLELMSDQAPWLCDALWEIPGLRPVWPSQRRPDTAPPPPNWVLVSLVDTPWTSPQLQDALARRGVFARECSNFRGLEIGARLAGGGIEIHTRGHLRFAVRTPEENRQVVSVLSSLMEAKPAP